MAAPGKNATARSPRIAIILAIAAVIVIAVAIVAGLQLMRRDDIGHVDGKALAKELGLRSNQACGKDVEGFRLSPDDVRAPVFVPNASWHWTRRCLDDLLEASLAADDDAEIHDFLERQVLRLLSRPLIRFHKAGDDQQFRLKQLVDRKSGAVSFDGVDRLSIVNRNDIAHNSLAQSLVGTWFLNAARALVEQGKRPDLAAEYETLGLAALNVVLDPATAHGLSSAHPCEQRPGETCTWYHAATKRSAEQPTEGGTLNKHLIVISRFAEAADALTAMDAKAPDGPTREADVQRLRAAARAGLYQLVYADGHVAAGRPPNLFDYVARDPEGNAIARSWLYYGLNPSRDRPGYFLPNQFKNCHYHIVDIRALGNALGNVGGDADLSGFRAPHPDLGGSILELMVRTLKLKQSEGMFADAPTTPPGNWAGCRPSMYSEKVANAAAEALLAAGQR